MIFVTVGTHNLHFDRLIVAADEYAATTDETVIVQYGVSKQQLHHAQGHAFLPITQMQEYCQQARVIVMHAGVGSVMTALEYPSRLVLVPRRHAFGEHIDDHQLELAEVLEHRGLVASLLDVSAEALRQAIERAPERKPGELRGEELSNAVAKRVANTMPKIPRSTR